MANTYILISSVTVGSGGASSVGFTSIPSTYTDLCLKMSAKAASTQAMYITINSSTSNFSNMYLYANPPGTPVSNSLNRYVGSVNDPTFNSTEIYFPNYASSTNKSFSVDNADEVNSVGNDLNLIAGLWSDSAAITSISIVPTSGNFTQYSTAYLYGISNA